jgi:hypothetical protein
MSEEPRAGVMVGVRVVGCCQQHAGIDDQHCSVAPEALSEHLVGITSPTT